MRTDIPVRGGEVFADYINCLWEEQKFSMQEICRGLCTVQEFHYLRTGERTVSRLLGEAVLERLGAETEDCEYFLNYADYRRWERRHHILHCITYERFQEAENLLEDYRREYCEETKPCLEYQFYLSMFAQLRRCRGASEEELLSLFDNALGQTVPDWGEGSIVERALSFKELNLMLERERYRKEGERPERYSEIVQYIDGRKFDRYGKAKIYPKAVCLLCRSALARDAVRKSTPESLLLLAPGMSSPEKEDRWTSVWLLQYSERALELLRDTGRMYYLWEILSVRAELLNRLAEEAACWKKQSGGLLSKMISLELLQKENREWKEVLEKTYEEFRVPRETFEDCCLYVVKGVSCVNDVLRVRRNMLEISLKDLSRGICDISTLRRLEKGFAKPQKFIVRAMLERMGLPGELARTELATGSPEAKKLMERIKEAANNRRWDEVEKLLVPLKELVTVKERCNQQVLMRKEVLLSWRRGEIDGEEYCRRMRLALEITLPYEAFLKEGKKYLTHEEQKCIHNRMLGMDKYGDEYLTCMRRFEEIYTFYEENDLLETVISMHNLIMDFVGSGWGSRGDYDRADKYNEIALQGCLRLRRLGDLHGSFYDRLWNNKRRIEKGFPVHRVLDAEIELKRCILLCEIDKSDDRIFYEKKLKDLKSHQGS